MFVVPLVPHTADRALTLRAVQHSLECLDQTTAGVLSRIQNKVDVESRRLDALDARIRAVTARVKQLQEDKVTAHVLTSLSAWPDVPASPAPLFADVSAHCIDVEPEDDNFEPGLVWRSADADASDPVVPLPALLELERRFKRAQMHFAQFKASAAAFPVPSSSLSQPLAQPPPQSTSPLDNALGNAPPSLTEDSGDEEPGVTTTASYRPSVKEARQLGLPPSLNLPDIANPLALLNRLPTNLNLPDIASTLVKHHGEPSALPPLPASPSVDEHEESSEPPSQSQSANARDDTAAPVPRPSTTSVALPPQPPDVRHALLAAIRGQPGKASLRQPKAGQPAATPLRPAGQLSLADEMREKLMRRQKALSGERDEEEQQGMRAMLARPSEHESASSASSSPPPMPSIPKRLSRKADKRAREPASTAAAAAGGGDADFVARRFAGIDVLLTRELAKLPGKKSTSKSTVSGGGSEWER